MLLRAIEVGQGTTREYVSKEESDWRDIETLVKQLHGEGLPEEVKGDTHVIAFFLSFQILPSYNQQISTPKNGCIIEVGY